MSASWRSAWAVVALCLVVLAAAATLLPCPDAATHGTRLILCLLAVEAAALAVAVPFLAARALGAPGRRARLLRTLLPVLGIEGISLAISAAAARGSVQLTTLLWSQLFYLAFAGLLAALTNALASLGLRATTAQVVATLVAIAMLGQVFFANSLVEAATGERAKMAVIDAMLWTNPWLIVGGSILQADPLRSENLYEWSVVIYYGFRYPGSAIAAVWARALFLSGLYAACAAAVQALAWLIASRPRRPANVQQVDSSCPL
ncbi:MAG TPA: hypothetical protein VNE39_13465 [Planctomycetota bacterium]|nr:hypothetical protein [Planctomycetota bacterium]